jgi:hypothetical protein
MNALHRRRRDALGLAGLFAAAAAQAPRPAAANRFEAWFAPAARLWPRWQAHDPHSRLAVDHGPWDRFLRTQLRRHRDGITRIAYGAVPAGARQRLRAYLGAMAAVPVSLLARGEQFAFWVNLYNALTVQVVLDAYLVAGIRDIAPSGGLFACGPWDARLIEVEGQGLTLNDIEHRILRPVWRDPRVHYAVNCASLGFPNLLPEAFTAARTEAMLEAATRDYVNHPRGVTPRVDGLRVSKIYAWYADDFGAGDAGVVAHLLRYAALPLAEAIRRRPVLAEFVYDWALNDAREGA